MSRAEAIDLAVFRIAVFALLLLNPDVWSAPPFAALPPELRRPPLGTAWLAAHLPISLAIARATQALLVVSSLGALVGWYTRVSAAVATVAALYLLGLPQLYGTVRHYHHLVWFAAILAAAPSGDALSLDARRRPAPPRAARDYLVPIYLAWALVGCIFFFAGYWKWRTGLAWALSDNLVNQMRWKWLQRGTVPWVRADHLPRLCRLGALAVMVFEVAFVFCLPFRRARALAVALAVLFHLATAMLLYIPFWSLLGCYVVFVPWGRLAGAARAGPTPRGVPIATMMVGGLLLVGNVVAGARGLVAGWPLACYPTFHTLAADAMPALELELEGADGAIVRRAPPRLAGDRQRAWALEWSIALGSDAAARARYLAELAGRDPAVAAARHVRLYRVLRPVDPARWHEPGRDRALLAAR